MSIGKRFMAYKIIKRLKEKKQHNILLQLKEGLIERDIKKGQKNKVFEDSFDAKPIYHRNFLLQKINYIHLNCVMSCWDLLFLAFVPQPRDPGILQYKS